MSHITQTRTNLNDKKFLLMALASLGFTHEEGNLKMRDFFGKVVPVEIIARREGYGQIGFHWNGESYDVVADWTLVKGFDQKTFTGSLSQRYAYHTTREKLEQQGFDMVEEKVEETGQIRLVLRRMG